ncbi:MAG TPA: hypothetical protein VKV32_01220 [Stellaceae bacterium]|nr:hypothetical protein [Stellaceae bacterium]
MKTSFATYAAVLALTAATAVAAKAATSSNPAQDRREDAITAQLNQQQLLLNGNHGYGVETYEGIMHRPNQGAPREQIAQPPSDDTNLSIIE